ncbi:MerR family transcriptional regulator [Candidatus Soleaferrea massiliensis]|uniref:MerR family transcriptional regulator n=1 Tax=Candidatus Soleaferrea massiliensis TaxID=1470354 RepID=UPI000590D17D|nr:MerR family transcriptional regulator [Candidatus Soleaferrea massiliensis]
MMTVKQVSLLTGVSIRTLQFYDEIGLFKPTKITDAGYRLYDENALETLQQILFFKELDFTLKEIKAIMENPRFDKTAAFKKQRELIQFKRDRLNALLELLDKLIKGERCMDFKDFDMSGYFRVLTAFKQTHADEIIEQFGSMEHFDEMVSEMKSREDEIAGMAVKQYGSLEHYTKAMEKNLEQFLSHGPHITQQDAGDLTKKTDEITRRLTADLKKDAASSDVQEIVHELISFTNACSGGIDMGENYWPFMAESYLSNSVFIEATDKKYGTGASIFIGHAIQAFLGMDLADN